MLPAPRPRTSLALALGATILGANGALLASCQLAPLPLPDLPRYIPDTCAFAIASRLEYQDWIVGSTDVGPSPAVSGVRLGLGGNVTPDAPGHADPSTSLGVLWQTGDPSTKVSGIRWGNTPDPGTWPAANRSLGVSWLTPPGIVNGDGAQRMHEVYVCGLEPATTYYYQVGGGPPGGEVWSSVYTFTTTMRGGDPGQVTFAVTGDSRGNGVIDGVGPAWNLLQKQLQTIGVDLHLFSGDMVNYPGDQTGWSKWIDDAWPSSTTTGQPEPQVLMLSAHGNHENHNTQFYSNVALPQEPDTYPTTPELFFSVDVGPVHVVVLDDSGAADTWDVELLPWLAADLSAAAENRESVPWIVVVQHRGLFSSACHGEDIDVQYARAVLVPLYDQYHVDMALEGHDHEYERTKPLRGPLVAPDWNPHVAPSPAEGTIYVVCGGAGTVGYPTGSSDSQEKSYCFGGKTASCGDAGPEDACSPVTCGCDVESRGAYSILTATRSSLTLTAHALYDDGTDPVVDTITINR